MDASAELSVNTASLAVTTSVVPAAASRMSVITMRPAARDPMSAATLMVETNCDTEPSCG